MAKIPILCIDDQREILAALHKDLEDFEEHCRLIDCESSAEALEALNEVDNSGEEPGLIICDHVMPGKNGVEFLIEVQKDLRFTNTRTILLTGLATHQDTITAINEAHIDHYIEKPWNREDLHVSVKRLLTLFVLDSGLDFEDYLPVLDQPTLYGKLHSS